MRSDQFNGNAKTMTFVALINALNRIAELGHLEADHANLALTDAC
jgi:hypothetical protein